MPAGAGQIYGRTGRTVIPISRRAFADGVTGGIWYDSSGNFIGDNLTTLRPADDAATQQLGSPWRMPTVDEIQELKENCTWLWTTQDGVNGHQVDGPNGNAIFLPASGYRNYSGLIGAGTSGDYLSSSLDTSSGYALKISFDSSHHYKAGALRCNGYPVRPVRP